MLSVVITIALPARPLLFSNTKEAANRLDYGYSLTFRGSRLTIESSQNGLLLGYAVANRSKFELAS